MSIRSLIILISVVGFGFVKFYTGELPINDRDAFAGWLALIGIVTYFFMD